MLYYFQSWSEAELGNTVLQKLFSGGKKQQIRDYKIFHKGLSSLIAFYVKKLISSYLKVSSQGFFFLVFPILFDFIEKLCKDYDVLILQVQNISIVFFSQVFISSKRDGTLLTL